MRPSKSVVIISRLGKFDTRLVLRAAVWYSNVRVACQRQADSCYGKAVL